MAATKSLEAGRKNLVFSERARKDYKFQNISSFWRMTWLEVKKNYQQNRKEKPKLIQTVLKLLKYNISKISNEVFPNISINSNLFLLILHSQFWYFFFLEK